MECEKNPFLEMSQDQIQKLDAVLRSEQAKALLQETMLGPAIHEPEDDHGVLRIETLSDLEHLVLDSASGSELFPVPNEDVDSIFHGNLDDPSVELDIVFMDHSYSILPPDFIKPSRSKCEEIEASGHLYISSEKGEKNRGGMHFATSKLNLRRSQRQIEKTEREQLEKIRAESTEIQRHEREEMERLKLQQENQNNSESSLPSSQMYNEKSKEEVGKKETQKNGMKKEVETQEEKQMQDIKTTKIQSKEIVNFKGIDEETEKGDLDDSNIEKKDENIREIEKNKAKNSEVRREGKNEREKNQSAEKTKDTKGKVKSSQRRHSNKEIEMEVDDSTKHKKSFRKKKINKVGESSKSDLESDIENIYKELEASRFTESLKPHLLEKSPDKSPKKRGRKKTVSCSSAESESVSDAGYRENLEQKESKKQGPRSKMFKQSSEDDEMFKIERRTSLSRENRRSLSEDKESSKKAATRRESTDMAKPTKSTKGNMKDSLKKVHLRRESHNSSMELFEPALFSQPDVMVKIKPPDAIAKKDDKAMVDVVDKNSNQLGDDQKMIVEESFADKHDLADSTNIESPNEDKTNIPSQTTDDCKADASESLLDTENEPELNSVEYIIQSMFAQNEASSDVNAFANNNLLKQEKEYLQENQIYEQNINIDKEHSVVAEESDKVESENLLKNSEDHIKNEVGKKLEKSNKNPINHGTGKESKSSLQEKMPTRNEETKLRHKKPRANPQQNKKKDNKKKGSSKNLAKKEAASSDETSSDDFKFADDPADSDWSSEDDPEKLWCICRKPHDDRFMIQCDNCQDWFHGTCVGVSRQQGRQLEKEQKEWRCPGCSKESVSTVKTTKKTSKKHSAKLSTKHDGKSLVKQEFKQPVKQDVKSPTNKDAKPLLKTDAKPLLKPDAKPLLKPDAKPLLKPDAKPLLKPDAKPLLKTDAKPLLKTDAKPLLKTDAKPLLKTDAKPLLKTDAKPLLKTDAKPLLKADAKPLLKADAKPSLKTDTKPPSIKPDIKPVAKQDAKLLTKPDARPVAKQDIKISFKQDAKPLLKQDVKPLIKQDGKPLVKQDVKSIKPEVKHVKQEAKSPTVKTPTPVVKQFVKSLKQDSKSSVKQDGKPSSEKVVQKSTPEKTPGHIKNVKEVPQNQLCIVCQKSSVSNSIYCSDTCIEHLVAERLSELQQGKDQKSHPKLPEDKKEDKGSISFKKLIISERSTGKIVTGENSPSLETLASWIKEHPTYEVLCIPFSADNRKEQGSQKTKDQLKKPQSQTQPSKKENDSGGPEPVRLNVRKTLRDVLSNRSKEANDILLSEEEIKKIALHIEEELFKLFKDTNQKYKSKYRSLMFNIKDPRNQGLFRKILRGKIPADRLVRMTPEELASKELTKWREMENKHALDMIKREQFDKQQSMHTHVIKKTHKGEVEIGADDLSPLEAAEKIQANSQDDSKNDLQSDTTNQHRTHLFDFNCKICTGKIVPPVEEEPPHKKVRVAHSISVDQSLIEMEQMEKIEQTLGVKSSVKTGGDATDDSADYEPSSTVSIGSPDSTTPPQVPSSSSTKSLSSVWKGFIFMQDITKFVTSAYKVSGPTDFLTQDIPDTVQVCGRIVPDQVWDYLGKIKQSGNKELIIVRFQPANDEEKVPYGSFFSYLSSRKRYGVVGNSSKMIKDFYILPLASYSPVPTVLMPFDGPGLDAIRPHLLLGVIVRHKTRPLPASSSLQTSAQTSDSPDYYERSYTPPLEKMPLHLSPTQPSPTVNNSLVYNPAKELRASSLQQQTSESTTTNIPVYTPSKELNIPPKKLSEDDIYCDDEPYEPSYTPPLEKMPRIESIASPDQEGMDDDNAPYDPEECEEDLLSQSEEAKSQMNAIIPPLLNSVTTKCVSDLIDEISKSSNPAELTTTVLASIATTPDIEQQKLLLMELTQKVEEQKRQIEQQRLQALNISGRGVEIEHNSSYSDFAGVRKLQENEQPDAGSSFSLSSMNFSGILPKLSDFERTESKNDSAAQSTTGVGLPQSLQDMLNSVKLKSSEQRSTKEGNVQENLNSGKDLSVDSSYNFEQSHVAKAFTQVSSKLFDESHTTLSTASINNDHFGMKDSSHVNEDSSSAQKPQDPRLRSKTTEELTKKDNKSSLSSMSASELLEKAKQELEEMEAMESAQKFHCDPSTNIISVDHPKPSEEPVPAAVHWEAFTEPPPPGIEPVEIHMPSGSIVHSSSRVGPESSLQSCGPPQMSQAYPLPPGHIPGPHFMQEAPPVSYMHGPPSNPSASTSCPQQNYPPPPLPPTPPPPQPPPPGCVSSSQWRQWPLRNHTGDVDWRPNRQQWEEEGWQDNRDMDYREPQWSRGQKWDGNQRWHRKYQNYWKSDRGNRRLRGRRNRRGSYGERDGSYWKHE